MPKDWIEEWKLRYDTNIPINTSKFEALKKLYSMFSSINEVFINRLINQEEKLKEIMKEINIKLKNKS